MNVTAVLFEGFETLDLFGPVEMFGAEELFPEVKWERNARWTVDGNRYVSSGVSAGTDMSLGFIADVCGREVAEKTARYAEYTWNSDPTNDPFAR